MHVTDIEDKENWHGKPLGGSAADVIKAIEENIVNKGNHGICPRSPEQTPPAANIKDIKLAGPMPYKSDQLVLADP